jgi:amino acid transporter
MHLVALMPVNSALIADCQGIRLSALPHDIMTPMKPRGDAGQHPGLRRSLSLPLTTFYGLGNILGAGIYVLIGQVVAHAAGFAPLSFLLASLLACLTAFSYAELSARYPLSAGEAVYVQEGLGLQALSALVGLLIILAGVVSAATILRGFTGYLQVFLPVPAWASILTIAMLLGGLAAWGIVESVRVVALITVVEIAGLLLVLYVAAPAVFAPGSGWPDFSPLLSGEMWYGIFLGGFLAFYAFIGFEDMVNVAEEVREPERNLPRAILLALLVATVLYFLVALAAVVSVPGEQLAESDAPLAWLYHYLTGREPVVITLISMFAVINGALIQIIMSSRVCYGMAGRRWLPAVFRRVNATTRTPLVATLVVTALVLLMALWLPIGTLAKSASYFLLLVFTLVNLSLWRLKLLHPAPAAIIRVPLWVPAAGCLTSGLFVAMQALLDMFGPA